MGGGWKPVSREGAIQMLQYIHGLSEKQSGELYDTFVSKYSRSPTVSEVKIGLGYKGGVTECRISAKSTTYMDKGLYIITTKTVDGELHGQRAVKSGDGWKYTNLTKSELLHLAV